MRTIIELTELDSKSRFAKRGMQHDGNAQAGAIIGKIIGEKQELRTRVKELSGLISKIVNEVNSLSIARAEGDS